MKVYIPIVAVILGTVSSLALAAVPPEAPKQQQVKPVVASRPKTLSPALPAVKETPMPELPVPMNAQRMHDQYGVERFVDEQTGAICYIIREKGALSCLPIRDTFLRPSQVFK